MPAIYIIRKDMNMKNLCKIIALTLIVMTLLNFGLVYAAEDTSRDDVVKICETFSYDYPNVTAVSGEMFTTGGGVYYQSGEQLLSFELGVERVYAITDHLALTEMMKDRGDALTGHRYVYNLYTGETFGGYFDAIAYPEANIAIVMHHNITGSGNAGYIDAYGFNELQGKYATYIGDGIILSSDVHISNITSDTYVYLYNLNTWESSTVKIFTGNITCIDGYIIQNNGSYSSVMDSKGNVLFEYACDSIEYIGCGYFCSLIAAEKKSSLLDNSGNELKSWRYISESKGGYGFPVKVFGNFVIAKEDRDLKVYRLDTLEQIIAYMGLYESIGDKYIVVYENTISKHTAKFLSSDGEIVDMEISGINVDKTIDLFSTQLDDTIYYYNSDLELVETRDLHYNYPGFYLSSNTVYDLGGNVLIPEPLHGLYDYKNIWNRSYYEVLDNGNVLFKVTLDSNSGNKMNVYLWVREDTAFDNELGDKPAFPPLAKFPFADVKSNSWYYDAVRYVYFNGLMNGITADTFEPNTPMSRAMLVTVLWRLDGSPAPSDKAPFTDLKQAWYKDAVAWAYENGVVTGTSADKFSPNVNITREQMAAILYRYSDYKGYDTSARTDISSYPDAGRVHDYAFAAFAWANAEGLITGTTENGTTILAPRASATRAQVATILMRFCEK